MFEKLLVSTSVSSRLRTLVAMAALVVVVAGSQQVDEAPSPQDPSTKSGEAQTKSPATKVTAAVNQKEKKPTPPTQQDKKNWTSLFNGKNLKGWKVTEFGGEGEVSVKNKQLVIDIGNPLSGVNYTGKTPKTNYEVELDAMRVSGSDFFCGLTFPVKKDSCSLILGGWGGGVIGLSSINGMDASENETTNYMEFKSKKWYHIRLRVLDDRIQAWIDKKEIVDQDLTDRKISIRIEVELSKPFGIANYETKSAIRNFRLRKLTKKEIAAAKSPTTATEKE